jgi:transketolase
MPCWELFNEQAKLYRDEVIKPNSLKVGIEAAVAMGWEKYIGDNGIFVGMNSFGGSGSATDLYEHFRITATRVVNDVIAALRSLNSQSSQAQAKTTKIISVQH